jgi:hypothetical protein
MNNELARQSACVGICGPGQREKLISHGMASSCVISEIRTKKSTGGRMFRQRAFDR